MKEDGNLINSARTHTCREQCGRCRNAVKSADFNYRDTGIFSQFPTSIYFFITYARKIAVECKNFDKNILKLIFSDPLDMRWGESKKIGRIPSYLKVMNTRDFFPAIMIKVLIRAKNKGIVHRKGFFFHYVKSSSWWTDFSATVDSAFLWFSIDARLTCSFSRDVTSSTPKCRKLSSNQNKITCVYNVPL